MNNIKLLAKTRRKSRFDRSYLGNKNYILKYLQLTYKDSLQSKISDSNFFLLQEGTTEEDNNSIDVGLLLLRRYSRALLQASAQQRPMNRQHCVFTGRTKGVLNKFKMSRMVFKEMSVLGLINGIKRASW